MDKNDFLEKVIGGILGAIAIFAALAELVLGGCSPESIAGTIKDISSTFIVIILLIAFANEHKKIKGLRGSIEKAMERLENGYSPLIREVVVSEKSGEAKKNKLEKVIRYEIAANTNVLFGIKSNSYAPFFDIAIDTPDKIEFYIRKKFFGINDGETFNAEKIYDKISSYINKQHEKLNMAFVPDASGGKIVIKFDHPLKYEKDIDMLIDIIDDMIFAYTVVNK